MGRSKSKDMNRSKNPRTGFKAKATDEDDHVHKSKKSGKRFHRRKTLREEFLDNLPDEH